MTHDLKERINHYRTENPRAHARDVAAALGVSEAELVATARGDGATLLDDRYLELFEALPSLGPVKTMTRNATAVLERWGTFEKVEIEGPMGQVVGEEIDLRLFLRRWRFAFALTETSAHGPRRSIQIFDEHGASVHKIYLEDEGRLDAYRALVDAHATDEPVAEPEPPPTHQSERPDNRIDVAGLRAAWDAMRDTHEIFGLLRRFGVKRTQALRLVGGERAFPVAPASFERALRGAAAAAIPVMLFVGNRGIIQIHSGVLGNVQRMHGWLNVLDPRVNVHLLERGLSAAWVVKKPTADGIVTSLELYDESGENVLLMFGKRKPGSAEDPRWRDLLPNLADAPEGG